jgi:3-phenylpropionate/trans-cinnamate dioxygenase ferredoxin reductase subunit
MSVPNSITIVGASLAGIRAAGTLRSDGFAGPITIIGDEAHEPYDRPPLSKEILAGSWEVDRAMLHKPEALAAFDLDWRLGRRATAFDAESLVVTLDDGTVVESEAVLIATGARPREIPRTGELEGVTTLRTLDDSLALRSEFERGPTRVVVVGAGFIGAEVAATARGRGLDVTMIEMADVPLERALGAQMGAVCAAVHRDHGVDLRLGVGVSELLGNGGVTGVALTDGSTVDADVVVVGVGVMPNTEWLEGSGLTIDNGIVCDETCLAAPGVVAAGDVARWPNRRFDEVMRVEHWDNAVEQGVAAARRLLAGDGPGEPFEPVPWFWSNQYDRKIQLAGRSGPDDEVEVVTGSIEERRFAALYGRAGRLVGVLGFNRPRHVMQYRQMIADGSTWDEALAFARSQE